jgi:hypothetical protein
MRILRRHACRALDHRANAVYFVFQRQEVDSMRFAHILAAALALAAIPVAAQAQPDPAPRLAAQRAAIARLSFMDGTWRGTAWTLTREGRHELTQTERVGVFLGGTVRVVEGRGYEADGTIGFNALGVISYDPDTRRYSFSAWAQGRGGVFPFQVTDTGFMWETPAGPGAIIRYTATVRDGSWHEVGERIAEGQPPLRVVELNLRRVGDTDWPDAGAVPMR